MNKATVARAATEPVRICIFSTLAVCDQNLYLAPDDFLILFPGNLLLQGDESFVTLLNDCLRNLVGHRRSRSSRSNRILKSEGRRESRFGDDSQRVLKILLRLPRKSDDDVGRDCRIGHFG